VGAFGEAAASRSPVVLVASEISIRLARPGVELGALVELLGAPVVATFAGRGVLPPEHPWLVGIPPHEPEVAAYVGDADLLLAVGTAFDGAMTRNWSMPRPPVLVSVNVSEADLDKNYRADVPVLASPRAPRRWSSTWRSPATGTAATAGSSTPDACSTPSAGAPWDTRCCRGGHRVRA
jgi:thiamine pyrophosphate-dependent acetolactate synthase large subunit-like protein